MNLLTEAKSDALPRPTDPDARPTPVSIHDIVSDDQTEEMATRIARKATAKRVDSVALSCTLVLAANQAGLVTTPLPTGPKSTIRVLAAVELFWPGWLGSTAIPWAIARLPKEQEGAG